MYRRFSTSKGPGLATPNRASFGSIRRQPYAAIHRPARGTGKASWPTDRDSNSPSWRSSRLGVLLRVGHYLANYPLWGDEAFLALSFLRRGYLDLLRPLEYGQVCPILFLWAELTSVKLFGFSEMSLRLCPLLCGVASVFLFRHVAGRVFRGPALLLAVATFAVSIHPIRHSADAKPYASDLLVALGMMALAIEWYRSTDRTGWLWLLVGFAPIALASSFPAVFVASGIAVALAPCVWKKRRSGPAIALAAYVLMVATTFAALFVGIAQRQHGTGTIKALQDYWADSFPPLDSPVRLVSWLIRTHAGSMFAYPGGGNRGASTMTLVLVLVAAAALWRRGQRTLLAILVMPMAVAIAAAALKLYPYGGQARIMQYLAPAICLLAGLGLSVLLSLPRGVTPDPPPCESRPLRWLSWASCCWRKTFGTPTGRFTTIRPASSRDVFGPSRRETPTSPACDGTSGSAARTPLAPHRLYLCNQHIYSPSRKRRDGPAWERVTADRPLRCVVFDEDVLTRPEATAWLESMTDRYVFRSQSKVVVPTTGLNQKSWTDHVTVFEFLPKTDPPHSVIAGRADMIRGVR